MFCSDLASTCWPPPSVGFDPAFLSDKLKRKLFQKPSFVISGYFRAGTQQSKSRKEKSTWSCPRGRSRGSSSAHVAQQSTRPVVELTWLAALASTPASSSSWTVLLWFRAAATCRAVSPAWEPTQYKDTVAPVLCLASRFLSFDVTMCSTWLVSVSGQRELSKIFITLWLS